MIDFPAAPVVGQHHSKWIWNGTNWAYDKSGFTFVQDAVPPSPSGSATWYQTSTGQSLVWSSNSWVQFSPYEPVASQISFTPVVPTDPYVPVTSALNVQAAVQEVATDTAANYALGIVAVGTMVPMSQTTVSANTVMTQPLAFTPLLGRRYRVKFKFRACQPVVAACNIYLRCIGSNNLASADTHTFIGGVHCSPEYECVFDGTGVASTYQIDIIPSNTVYCWTEQIVSFFHIQDIGPAR